MKDEGSPRALTPPYSIMPYASLAYSSLAYTLFYSPLLRLRSNVTVKGMRGISGSPDGTDVWGSPRVKGSGSGLTLPLNLRVDPRVV